MFEEHGGKGEGVRRRRPMEGLGNLYEGKNRFLTWDVCVGIVGRLEVTGGKKKRTGSRGGRRKFICDLVNPNLRFP